MKPNCAGELAMRAMKNHTIILKKEDNGEDAYASVALISSMLFTVISLNEEGLCECIEKSKSASAMICNYKHFPSKMYDYLGSPKKFSYFIRDIRNSIAHNNFGMVYTDDYKIVGMYFFPKKDEDNYIYFNEKELKTILERLVNIYMELDIDAKTKPLSEIDPAKL